MQEKERVLRKGKCYSLKDHREKQWCRDEQKRNGGEKGKML